MLFADCLVVLRGGGDLATGVAWRLHRAGFPIVICELADPLTVRRSVALSSAVTDGAVVVEGLRAERTETIADAVRRAVTGIVPVLVAADLPTADLLPARVVIDARLAKRNIDTSIDDAALVVGLGPGFVAGVDCHAVVETMRGPRLGRVLWDGSAAPNTGMPGEVGGRGADRVLRAPEAGEVLWAAGTRIGEVVAAGAVLGHVGQAEIVAPFSGVVRGAIRSGARVTSGLKVGDLDPRLATACDEISDKSLSVGGGVVEAVMTWLNRSSATR